MRLPRDVDADRLIRVLVNMDTAYHGKQAAILG